MGESGDHGRFWGIKWTLNGQLASTKKPGTRPGFRFPRSGGKICLRGFAAQMLSPAVNRRSRAGPARVNPLNTSI